MSGKGGSGAEKLAADGPEPAFGWWPSPWPASAVAAGKVSRSGLQVDGVSVFWSESRPDEGGRQVVVCARPGMPLFDASPRATSVRSRVHEYGGGAATVADGVLYYVDQGDQRWYRAVVGEESAPTALSPELRPGGPSLRYADGRLTRSGRWLLSVEESVGGGTTDHRLVAVATDGSQSRVPLVDQGDFVTAPRPSPDGRWLAWMTWDHPFMPWDESEVWVARLEEDHRGPRLDGGHPVAGGGGTSVGQPQWCRDGSLLFVDDRSGWWLPYRLGPERRDRGGRAEPLVDLACEFHAPDWVVGQSTMAELPDGSLVCRMHDGGRDLVVRLRPPEHSADPIDRPDPPPWSVQVVDQPCVSISGVAAPGVGIGSPGGGDPGVGPDWVWVIGSTAREAQGVYQVSLHSGRPVRRLSAPPGIAPAVGEVSSAVAFTAPTAAGPVPGLFFAPANARFPGGVGRRPPLVVFCHGGPTSAAECGFDPVVQFFTSRGLAVAVVDYRGSSGYGRAYRRGLDGLWGEADVDDCVNYALALERAGRVDGRRMAIRGTSAGGLTALGALIRARRFAGAVAWYGVTDLEALVAETHDFESRYVDSLVGPWPQEATLYRARSPVHHPEQVSGQVLLLQGTEDPVVPAAQSQRFADQLREHDVACRLIMFGGETHGFRRADTIEACLTAELDFYRSLFGESESPPPGPTSP